MQWHARSLQSTICVDPSLCNSLPKCMVRWSNPAAVRPVAALWTLGDGLAVSAYSYGYRTAVGALRNHGGSSLDVVVLVRCACGAELSRATPR